MGDQSGICKKVSIVRPINVGNCQDLSFIDECRSLASARRRARDQGKGYFHLPWQQGQPGIGYVHGGLWYHELIMT